VPAHAIRLARPDDVGALPAIERAAARLFDGLLPESLMEETTALEDLAAAQAVGRLWVALADDVPVGFAHVVLRADGVPHLEEIDVHPDHGRRGLGAALVQTVCDWAAANGHRELTLTTFRDVAWNAPLYARLGFAVVDRDDWPPAIAAIVAGEASRGLDPATRVVMAHRPR
jgi:GNAT superfamily N-acetyltransferase